jgi:hypothetical protein
VATHHILFTNLTRPPSLTEVKSPEIRALMDAHGLCEADARRKVVRREAVNQGDRTSSCDSQETRARAGSRLAFLHDELAVARDASASARAAVAADEPAASTPPSEIDAVSRDAAPEDERGDALLPLKSSSPTSAPVNVASLIPVAPAGSAARCQCECGENCISCRRRTRRKALSL